MTPSPSERATGVKTDGELRRTTQHLNLTVTMEANVAEEVRRKDSASTQTRAKRDVYVNRFSSKRAQDQERK